MKPTKRKRYYPTYQMKNFADYCERIKLPVSRYDLPFIQNQIRNKPYATKKAILMRYIELFQAGMAKETDIKKKANTGRYRANCWLREVTSKTQLRKKGG